MHSRLLRVAASFYMCGDILKNHNGIVHYHTYRYRQCGQRNDIERIACYGKIYEGCYKRYGDGDGDDQGGSPASEEGEYHNHHKQQCVQYRFDKRGYGIADIIGGVDDYAKLHIRRQTFLKRRQHLEHL